LNDFFRAAHLDIHADTSIVAVKVKYDTDNSATLLICIDAEQIEESEGWFVANVWGDCDIQDIFNCVKGAWELSNN
jgi:hypothetical protein